MLLCRHRRNADAITDPQPERGAALPRSLILLPTASATGPAFLTSYFSYFVGASSRPAFLTGLSRAAEVCRSLRPVRQARTGARGHRTGGLAASLHRRRGTAPSGAMFLGGRVDDALSAFHRYELASALHDYIEHFHNARRRHSALGMKTPAEAEAAWFKLGSERQLARTAPLADDVQPRAAGLSAG